MSPTETKESTTKREIEVEVPAQEVSRQTEALIQKYQKVAIEVEVPAQEVSRQTEALIQKYQKVARLPGFRAGHVPPSIIRQRFSEEIKTDVVEALIPRYFRQETERLGMHPVSQPRVTDLHLHDGEPLRFKAAFEVLPEVKAEGYKDLRAEKPEITITDADVDQAIAELRE
ncbi:MAG: trigger factor, partial [Acidobacteria bacterium]